MKVKVKVCKECGRVNLLDAEECIECRCEELDEIDLTPSWVEED